MQQIPLDIKLKTDATFDNFIAGDNQILITQLLELSPQAPDFIYIYGEQGVGKSHLLQAVNHHFSNQFANAMIAYLPLDNPMLKPQMLEGFSAFDCVCLDDVDMVAQDKHWQQALFNLYNQLKDQGKSLLVTAKVSPKNLQTGLADLRSRLSAMLIHSIASLSDQDKLHFIQSKAEDKGLMLEPDVARFLLNRQQRDLPSLLAMLDKLDKASMQAQRKLTIPFVKNALK